MMPFHTAPLGRRRFLALSGACAAGIVIAGCGDDEEVPARTTPSEEPPPEPMADVTLDFATTAGVLNYAYALEQLEAAFYAQVNLEFEADGETFQAQLRDIGAHEQVHADFLAAVLADDAIPALEPNFEMVDFSDRESVLQTAFTFENLGVGAYNGAARFLARLASQGDELAPTALMAAGDIVAVEARHASVIGAQLQPGQDDMFAPNAFDPAMPPSEVVEAAQPFIRQRIAVTNADRQGG